MNAPLRISEASAHLAIVTILDRAIDEEWHWKVTHSAVYNHLEAFAPRCNCGRVLQFGPWRAGSRIVACRCGVSFFEAKL